MNKINLLPQELINLIAAGEVVERPSSVVKELVENSIDAGSTEIVINIEESGSKLIEVKDNGHGIAEANAQLVLQQHATSKISNFKDLESIYTLGFRGEALASIASVSEYTIIKSKTSDESGIEIIKDSKGQEVINKTQSKDGTTISIHNLFANIPARKKFLKKQSTEENHIIETFLQTVLPYIDIHFEIYIDKKLTYKLTRTRDINTRLFEIFGKTTAKNVFNNSIELNSIKISGQIGNSFIAKKANKQQFIYINNRFVKSSLIAAAINQAYTGQIHRDLKPTYFLFLELNPNVFDINVHPRKLEVKFTDDKTIFSTVFNFTKKTLEKYSKSLIDNNFSISQTDEPDFIKDTNSSPKFIKPNTTNKLQFSQKSTPSSEKPIRTNKVNESINFSKELYSFTSGTLNAKNDHNNYVDNFKVNDLGGSKFDSNPNLNTNPFQIFNTYICYERENRFILIDQHAAAEKVLFEKLIKQVGHITTKPLLVPEIINLSSAIEKQRILEIKEELEKLGFIIDDFGGESLSISEIPEISDIHEFDSVIQDFLKNENDLGVIVNEEIINFYNLTKSSYLKIATMACHGAIRAGQILNSAEMINLINDIKNIEGSLNCPHGRPILWELSKNAIEKNFNRDI